MPPSIPKLHPAATLALWLVAACTDPVPARRPTAIDIIADVQRFSSLGDTSRFRAAIRDSESKEIDGTVTWSSTEESVVRIDRVTGLATAIANGTADIVASLNDLKAARRVEVQQVIAALSVSAPFVKVWNGLRFDAGVTGRDANGFAAPSTALRWQSSDSSIVLVAASGELSARSRGTATVTATSGAASATVEVTVTTISGVLDVNATMTRTSSPYVLADNVLIPAQRTLRIEPGVTLLFPGPYYVRVDGALTAIGTSADSIHFTSGRPTKAAGDWRHILFTRSSVPATVDVAGNYVSGSAIAFAEISYGGAIQFDGSSPYFSNNHVHHVRGTPPRDWPTGAIWACKSASIIRDNVIEDNPTTGIYVGGGNARIRRNLIRSNVGDWGGGMWVSAPVNANCDGVAGTVEIEDNRIVGNTANFGAGILIYSGAPIIRYNDIIDNRVTSYLSSGLYEPGGAAIATLDMTAPQITYNNIENNGATSSGRSTAVFVGESFTGFIRNNNISNQTKYEIFMHTLARGVLDASSNFWNTSAATTLDERLWDYVDDFELAQIRYTPVLTSRQSGAGPRPGLP